MPRQNPYFNNLSEHAFLSEREAVEILEEYCSENDIPIYALPNGIINDFIQTIRYAPYDITTEEVANRIGIQIERNEEWYNNYMSTPQRFPDSNDVVSQVIRSATTRNAISQELLRDTQMAIAEDIRDVRERPTINTPTFNDDVLDSLVWATSNNGTAKKKKRPRSEKDMMTKIVRSDKFPRPNFKDWSSNRELDRTINDWHNNVEYREQWIFSRREREGFNRRNIGSFSLDDVMSRMNKRKKPHALDTETSKFYDWKLGGTDWTLRLELYQHEQYYFLITRHIHKPNDIEIKFDVRYWSNDRFKQLNFIWCQQKNTPETFDRVFGSNDENSPYYVQPYDEDDYEEDYEEQYEEEEEYEDSPF